VQPRLSALLAHDATRAPRRKAVIKTLVRRAHCLFTRQGFAGVVKSREIAHPVIRGRRHHPGVAALAQNVAESCAVLKDKSRLRTKRIVHGFPVDGVREVNVEVRDYWPTLHRHVRRRREISALDVLQLRDQRLLRGAPVAGVPLDCALVHHDRKGEAAMRLRLSHDQLCGLVNAVVRAIPIDKNAIDSATDHVRDLAVDLRLVHGAIAHVHMVGLPEPKHEVGIDLGVRARVEQ